MPTATDDGARLRLLGVETVVFVEELGYGRRMWRRQRRALDEYDTVVRDNRGTGESDTSEGPDTVGEMVGDLAFADEMPTSGPEKGDRSVVKERFGAV